MIVGFIIGIMFVVFIGLIALAIHTDNRVDSLEKRVQAIVDIETSKSVNRAL